MARRIIIDNFSTGTTGLLELQNIGNQIFLNCGTGIVRCGASKVGYRMMNLIVGDNPHNHKITVSVSKGLWASAGYKVGSRIELIYGINAKGENCPLNLNLSTQKEIVLEFDGSDKSINFSAILYDVGSYIAFSDNIPESASPFSKRIPLSAFGDPTPEIPFNWKAVQTITFVFQNTGAILANDFGVRSIHIE